MDNAVVRIFVDDEGFEIPFSSIKDFKVVATIQSSYPYGELVLDDPQGRYLATLAIRPGNIIRIVVIPQYYRNKELVVDETMAITFSPMRVVSIENKSNSNAETRAFIGSLGGEITIKMTHPWELFSDYTNRSFMKKCSKIIREVLENSKRGFTFEANQIKIDESDDVGTIIRYKLGESEAAFIQQKILPFTTINKMPAYGFIDEKGVFHLHNFKTMYGQEAKGILLPPFTEGQGAIISPEDKNLQIQQILDGSWGIGRKFTQQLGNFKKTILVDAPDIKTSFKAQMLYTSSIPGRVPLKQAYLDAMASGVAVVNILPFREFEDAIRLDVNSNSVMDKFFQIEVITTIAIDVAVVGFPVKLSLATNKAGDEHWASGKWLVTRAVHFTQDGKYYSKLFLAKPALESLPSSLKPEQLFTSK